VESRYGSAPFDMMDSSDQYNFVALAIHEFVDLFYDMQGS
jgi:hypothetical protein